MTPTMDAPETGPWPTVCFDLDGTLTDSAQGIVNSFGHTLDALGMAPPPPAAVLACVGPPLRVGMGRLLATDDAQRIEAAVTIYREYFADVGLFENRLYDGIVPLLERLTAADRRLLVVTAKAGVYARRILAHFELDRFFEAVYGSQLDGGLGTKTELLAHVLEREALAPSATVMVGDRHYDMDGARANQVAAIGVLWGYGTHAELSAAGAGRLCETPAGLGDVLLAAAV